MVSDDTLRSMKDQGLSMRQIAESTGLPVGSIKSRFYRLRHGRWAVGKWIRMEDAERLIREAYDAGQYALGVEDFIAELKRLQK